MPSRSRQPVERGQEGLPFPEITIGEQSPEGILYKVETRGNLILPAKCNTEDLLDPRWGMSYFGPTVGRGVIVGRTKVMLDLFAAVAKMSPLYFPVLLTGATGTGKELLAAALSSGRGGPFVTGDCGVCADGLTFDDMFFGRTARVLNGAPAEAGKFYLANGGTLLIDNIQNLSWSLQARLLKPVESYPQHIRPLGSSKEVSVKVRIVSASNKELLQLIEAGQFMPDLYERISTLRLNVPALCERKEDIDLLAAYFVLKNRSCLPRKVHTIARGTLEKLKAHNWPRNVRELRNCIERALAMGDGPILEPSQISFEEIPCVQGHFSPRQMCVANSGNGLHRQVDKRRNEIVGLLRRKPGQTTKELAREFSCSGRTVNRSFSELCEQGLVKSQPDKDDGRIIRYYTKPQ